MCFGVSVCVCVCVWECVSVLGMNTGGTNECGCVCHIEIICVICSVCINDHTCLCLP